MVIFIQKTRFQISWCFIWISTRKKPSHRGRQNPPLHCVTGKATLTGTWLGCCAGDPLLTGCCWTAACSILLMCVMKRNRSFKAGLKLQIIFSTCLRQKRNAFGKTGIFWHMPLLYTNTTLAQQKKEKHTVNNAIYVNVLFTMLTSGPLLITNLKSTLPGTTVVHQSVAK